MRHNLRCRIALGGFLHLGRPQEPFNFPLASCAKVLRWHKPELFMQSCWANRIVLRVLDPMICVPALLGAFNAFLVRTCGHANAPLPFLVCLLAMDDVVMQHPWHLAFATRKAARSHENMPISCLWHLG